MRNLKISPKAEPITLLNCLTKFTEREELGEADPWYCPKCKTHVRAFKKFDLFSLPKVLIFHLKRFRYAQSSFYMHRDKIATLVDFPTDGLDLSEFVVGPQDGTEPMYDLFAVSEHMGGLGGGHYTAVAKNPVNQRWFNFNDSHTSETSAESAVSARAYVLFYIRRGQA
jgi:ubiquitin carboxyl-terminal hydrolase 4/11/15